MCTLRFPPPPPRVLHFMLPCPKQWHMSAVRETPGTHLPAGMCPGQGKAVWNMPQEYPAGGFPEYVCRHGARNAWGITGLEPSIQSHCPKGLASEANQSGQLCQNTSWHSCFCHKIKFCLLPRYHQKPCFSQDLNLFYIPCELQPIHWIIGSFSTHYIVM